MLVSLSLRNFRGFKDHFLPIRPETIMVGRNNAGKSTITEALRLVSIITARYGAINFNSGPAWLNLPLAYRGISPSLKGLDFNDLSIFYNLGDPPSRIDALFDSGIKIEIYLGREANIFSIIINKSDEIIRSKSQALKNPLPSVSILPQIGPLSREENILDSDYVRRVSTTPLASNHFRNHLRLNPESYSVFTELAQSTWPGLRILELVGQNGYPGDPLALLIQDGNFVAEVAWMGHGLQMWLQVLWFLAQNKDAHSIILDEPDVYLHADLQRKLVRLLRERHPQTIIATHSIEIISEIDPDNILIIERDSDRSNFATSLPVVQDTINTIGSIHNLHLTRLWNARKILLIEGKDISYLKIIQNKLSPMVAEPIDSIPNMQIGGWGGWQYAIGSKLLLKNAFDETIIAYCILDSDYHTLEEIVERLEEAEKKGINLRVWPKKEIENYFISPEVIARIISQEVGSGREPPKAEDVIVELDKLMENERDYIFDILATEYLARDRKSGVSNANKRAREVIDNAWISRDGKLSIVSGKTIISQLSNWSQKNYKVSLSPKKILKGMERSEIHPDLARVVRSIEQGKPF